MTSEELFLIVMSLVIVGGPIVIMVISLVRQDLGFFIRAILTLAFAVFIVMLTALRLGFDPHDVGSQKPVVAALPFPTPYMPAEYWPTPKPPRHKLALISASCFDDVDFIECEGFVQNITNLNPNTTSETMQDVVAVVALYADATPISSESALIDYDPLLPGQVSPFEIVARYNPKITGWHIEFRTPLGDLIPTIDARQKDMNGD